MGNTVGERIRQFRVIKNLSQENVAEELNMSNGNYGKIERGEIDISSTHLIKLARLFNIQVGEFFLPFKIGETAEPDAKIGFVTKDDFSQLIETVRKLTAEVERLSKKDLTQKKMVQYKHGKRKSKKG
ncbi:MAG: helix-turn-helix domain-containing protein [Bacteroidota bacterium]|jgi:transcriptional regulator with XRE-family HTH domain